jgi:hypothetical protein
MASQSIAAGASDLALQKARGATGFRMVSGVVGAENAPISV